MLNHLAADVNDVQGSVGSIRKLRWTKPDVTGIDKFRLFVDPVGNEGCSVGFELLPVDQVAANIANDREPFPLGWPCIATVDCDPRCAGEVASRATSALNRPGNQSPYP